MSMLLQATGIVINYAQVPNPAPIAPPGLANFTNQVLGWLKYLLIAAAVGGLIAASIMMVIGLRGRSEVAKTALSHVPFVIGGVILSGAASTLIASIQ